MILDNEREVQREFNAVYNHLVELKYALDQKKDSRSNRILGLILIHLFILLRHSMMDHFY